MTESGTKRSDIRKNKLIDMPSHTCGMSQINDQNGISLHNKFNGEPVKLFWGQIWEESLPARNLSLLWKKIVLPRLTRTGSRSSGFWSLEGYLSHETKTPEMKSTFLTCPLLLMVSLRWIVGRLYNWFSCNVKMFKGSNLCDGVLKHEDCWPVFSQINASGADMCRT